jgi:hypothetical protein
MTRTSGFLLVAALLTGCSGSATTPSAPAPVNVTVQTLPSPGGPDTALFAMTVKNISGSAVDLMFPSSCQILPHFLDRRTGQEVTPRGGGTACLTVVTHLSLVVGESFTQPVTVAAGDAPIANRVVLPAGDYMIYARLEDSMYQLKSDQVQFSVR